MSLHQYSFECHELVCRNDVAVTCEWAPDGRHFLTATIAPRLNVDNGYQIWRWAANLLPRLSIQCDKDCSRLACKLLDIKHVSHPKTNGMQFSLAVYIDQTVYCAHMLLVTSYLLVLSTCVPSSILLTITFPLSCASRNQSLADKQPTAVLMLQFHQYPQHD